MVVAQRTMPAYHSPVYQVALAALEVGVSVLPIRPDGSKQPALPGWKPYQQEMPTQSVVEEWFRHSQRGLALVTGHISGGLIALDFDDLATFDAWLSVFGASRLCTPCMSSSLLGYEERTPKNGRHLLFRCPAAFSGSQRPGKPATRAATRAGATALPGPGRNTRGGRHHYR